MLHGGSAAGRGPGATVVIPSFRGADALGPTLASLAAQTVSPDRFEVVVVVNGPVATDRGPFEALRQRWPDHRIRLVMIETAGASLAWNIGVQAARMEWLTFVDDDDTVAPRFLEALLDAANPGVVPLTEIHDVHADGSVDESGSLNQRIRAVAGSTVAAARLPQALGFNASKLLPTRWAKGARYGTSMTNGQDVAYFGTLSLRHDIVFAVPADARDAAYLRGWSDTSMSRQAMSFEFSIDQRLEVIETLDRERRRAPRVRRAVADHLVESQAHMMNRYLSQHLDARPAVLDSIRRRNLSAFPYQALNRAMTTRIVVLGPGEWSEVLRAAQRWDEPFDVVVVDPGTAQFDPWPRGRRNEQQGRVVRAESAGAALTALASSDASTAAYREVVSTRHPETSALAGALADRLPGLRHVTIGARRDYAVRRAVARVRASAG